MLKTFKEYKGIMDEIASTNESAHTEEEFDELIRRSDRLAGIIVNQLGEHKLSDEDLLDMLMARINATEQNRDRRKGRHRQDLMEIVECDDPGVKA